MQTLGLPLNLKITSYKQNSESKFGEKSYIFYAEWEIVYVGKVRMGNKFADDEFLKRSLV